MNKSLSDSTRIFFEEFCKRLDSQKKIFHGRSSGCKIIEKILHHKRYFLESFFGDFGKRLYDFFSVIDIDHPDLENCFDGIFRDENDFSIFFDELISVCDFSHKNSFSNVGEFIKKSSLNYIQEKYSNFTRIEIPDNNRCNVRFLKDKEKIKKIRSQKKMQIIDLHGVYKKGMSYYENHPNDFYKYLRFDESLISELQKMDVKASRYEQIGCHILAGEIRKSLANFQEHAKNTYFGFNRITMSSASIVLAKSMGFEMKTESATCEFTSDNYRIHIKKDYLYNIKVLDDIDCSYYEYQPVIYPLYDFESILTANMKNVLNILDNFPEANNKPIFDFYGIIVPSIKLPTNQSSYAFVDSTGCEKRHQVYDEFKLDFDRYMVANNIFYPIIVAEKDHKCYFITYWL